MRVETAGEHGSEIVAVVATDEHRLVVQHLDRIDTVDDEPLQLRVERRPCRAVGDAGKNGVAASRHPSQARRSEDRFGGNTERVGVFCTRLAQQRDGVAFLAAVLLAETAESSRSTTRVSTSTAVAVDVRRRTR